MILLLLLASPGLSQDEPEAEPQVRVGIIPVSVEGDYQPLDSEKAASLLYQGILENKPKAEMILLDRQDQVQTLSQALEVGKAQGLDMILWGVVRFKKEAMTDYSPSPYYRGRLEIQVATEADVKAAWVPDSKLVLSQPTLVVASKKTRSWVTDATRDLSTEQKIAASSIREVADSLVHVIRRRHQSGWLKNH